MSAFPLHTINAVAPTEIIGVQTRVLSGSILVVDLLLDVPVVLAIVISILLSVLVT